MHFAPTIRRLTYLALMMVFFLAAGCAIQDPKALTDLYKADKAIASAKKDGAADRFPDDYASLEKRYLNARGTFYACQEDKASEMAMALIADANALAAKRMAPPKKAMPKPANNPPVARLLGPSQGNINDLLSFNSGDSSDPDNDKLTYRWDFGDGNTATYTLVAAPHRYRKVGNYTVQLTVDDGRGGTDTTSKTVQIVSLQVIQGDVLFDTDKSTLKSDARDVLDNIVTQMKDNATHVVHLVGHTDSRGSAAYNMRLSEKRAKAVKYYLIAQGIKTGRITAEWQGESAPVASNKTKEGRSQNRRTEITFKPGS